MSRKGLLAFLGVGCALGVWSIACGALAQDRATLERCASRYGAAAHLVEAKAKGDSRFAGWSLPPNAASLPLRQRSLQTEDKLLATVSSVADKAAVSDKVVSETVSWVETTAEEGAAAARAVFAGARRCDQDLKLSPVLDEMPAATASAAAAGAAPGWGQESTLACAVNYYFAANATRRQDLLARASEAMRRYATPKGLAPAAVQAEVVAKGRAMAAAPPPAEQLQAALSSCDRTLGF